MREKQQVHRLVAHRILLLAPLLAAALGAQEVADWLQPSGPHRNGVSAETELLWETGCPTTYRDGLGGSALRPVWASGDALTNHYATVRAPAKRFQPFARLLAPAARAYAARAHGRLDARNGGELLCAALR